MVHVVVPYGMVHTLKIFHMNNTLKVSYTTGRERMGLNGAVQTTKTRRSAKVDGPEIRKLAVQRTNTGRSKGIELDGLKKYEWMV